MTVHDILIERLRELGADGLCYEDCGCGIDDLQPCESSMMECVPAKRGKEEGEHDFLYWPLKEAK